MGCTVFIVAETRNAIHGDRRRRCPHRPARCRRAGGVFGARLTALADRRSPRGCASPTTTTWARWSERADDPCASWPRRAVGASAARHRPRGLGRRRSRRARAPLPRPHQPRPHQGRAPRRDAARRGRRTGASSTACSHGVYTVPGDGGIDFAAVFRESPGYSGWVVHRGRAGPGEGRSAGVCDASGYAYLARQPCRRRPA